MPVCPVCDDLFRSDSVAALRRSGLVAVTLVLLGGLPAVAVDVPCQEPPSTGDLVTAERVAGGLLSPVGVYAAPGDTERLFVLEQSGRIRIVMLADGRVLEEPFLRLSVRTGGERGLLGMAFHRNYAENGRFFVYYSRPQGSVCTDAPVPGCFFDRHHESVVSRFEVSQSDPNKADSESEKELLAFCQPFGNHNGGWIGFGPLDPYLYIATGDGGSGGDPCGSGQRVDSYLGKILRIDVDIPDGILPYGVPATNPFVGDKDPDDLVLDEIWALGLRNPWRCSFDSATGDFYVADVGQRDWEEINIQPGDSAGGANYEWDAREGDHVHDSRVELTAGTPTPPLFEYHQRDTAVQGCSVTGGVVYRGCRMPDLTGTYFFADYCQNWVRSFKLVDGEVTDLRLLTNDLAFGADPFTIRSISSFGTDAEGEIYLCDHGGEIFRLISREPNAPPNVSVVTEPASGQVLLGATGGQAVLDASSSDNGDGGSDDLTFRWRKLDGPSGGDEIAEPAAARTRVDFTLPGSYRYEVTVGDGLHVSKAEVVIEVLAVRFVRGEANGDGVIDVSDGVFILTRLFLDASLAVLCEDALDTNDDGILDLTDGVFLLAHQFLGGAAPAAPYPECEEDPTRTDPFDCETSSCS